MNFSIGQCVSGGPSPMYAWKHSIHPFAYCSWPLTQLSGPADHMCRWPSTMKYFSPFFSYILPSYLADGLQVEANVLRCVLGVGKHDDPVVEHDHATVVRRHDLLEVVVAEGVPAERFGALRIVDLELPDTIDADHRRQLFDGDA